jgi:pimeloyl-ACP methyl ester carboxylesterase
MELLSDLRSRLESAFSDPELPRLGAGLSGSLRLEIAGNRFDLSMKDGFLHFELPEADPDIAIVADEPAWAMLLRRPPPPTFHTFTALDLANPRFRVVGDRLRIAQARPVLERLFERVTAIAPRYGQPVERDLAQVLGRYAIINSRGVRYEVYVETAGQGVPLLFLHTAGADSRQFQAQLSDCALARRFRMVAVDLPFHGRSMPPNSWDGGPYKLDTATYRDWCVAFIEQLIGERAVVCGGSMGAAMTLVMAKERPDLLRGVIAIEPPYQSRRRRDQYQHHMGVHGALHNSSFVRSLMSPESPEQDRRRTAWIYEQSAGGIYPGDLAFYSEEFDGALVAPGIDGRQTPIVLLCGDYDYSASPEQGRKLAALIPGAKLEIMLGIGHFPMCENPDLFRAYLLSALGHVEAHVTHGTVARP